MSTTHSDRGNFPTFVEAAVALLRERLPDDWTVELTSTGDGPDAALRFTYPGNSREFLVEAIDDLRPRDVGVRFASGLTRRLRLAASYQPLLVVAPTLSAQTRAALKQERVNYLDALGNAWVTAASTPLVIDIEPAVPAGRARTSPAQRNLAGSAVGGVVRSLVDGRPPVTLGALAQVAGISLGYCSRVVGLLDAELLVERTSRGGVATVDWAALLRRRGEVTRLFRGARSFVARQGVEGTIEQLRDDTVPGSWCITGSHAAARYAPVTAPAGLTVWTAEPEVLADRLGLLPVEEGGDVRLLQPSNPAVFDRMDDDTGSWWQRSPGAPLRGARWAAPSQVVIDCLGGTGRMPQEGEALLEWLQGSVDQWRTQPVSELARTGRALNP